MKNKFFCSAHKKLKSTHRLAQKDTNSKKLCAEKEDDYENSISKWPGFCSLWKSSKRVWFFFPFSNLEANSEKPADSVIYVPSADILEAESVFSEIRDNCYGGMPIQIGYCNGTNTKLNCFEYHRDSEIDIACRWCNSFSSTRAGCDRWSDRFFQDRGFPLSKGNCCRALCY